MIFRGNSLLAAGLALVLALSGCTAPAETTGPGRVLETSAPTHEQLSVPTVEGTATFAPEKTATLATAAPGEDIARAAAVEAARRLGTPEDRVKVVSVEPVDWPSPALGCPLPGLEYGEGVQPGYLVRLEVDGVPYEVHTGNTGQMVLCGQDGRPVLPELKVTPGEIDDGKPWQPVD